MKKAIVFYLAQDFTPCCECPHCFEVEKVEEGKLAERKCEGCGEIYQYVTQKYWG